MSTRCATVCAPIYLPRRWVSKIHLQRRPQVLIMRSVFLQQRAERETHLFCSHECGTDLTDLIQRNVQLYRLLFPPCLRSCVLQFVCARRWLLVLSCACLHLLWLGRETLPLTAPEQESAAGRARAWRTLLEHAHESTVQKYEYSNPYRPDFLYNSQTMSPVQGFINPVKGHSLLFFFF